MPEARDQRTNAPWPPEGRGMGLPARPERKLPLAGVSSARPADGQILRL